MLGNHNRKGWSGELPLHKDGKNNIPWLLKGKIKVFNITFFNFYWFHNGFCFNRNNLHYQLFFHFDLIFFQFLQHYNKTS